jgi:hypothetical protein
LSWLTSFSFIQSGIFLPQHLMLFTHSQSFNFTTLAVLLKPSGVDKVFWDIHKVSQCVLCFFCVYQGCIHAFFKPFRFIITSVICPEFIVETSSVLELHVSLAVMSRIISTRALRKIIWLLIVVQRPFGIWGLLSCHTIF